MCRLFPCIPIFRGFFRLKSVKKCVCVINLKNAVLPMRSKLLCWLTAKHSTATPQLEKIPRLTASLLLGIPSTLQQFFHPLFLWIFGKVNPSPFKKRGVALC